MKYTKINVKIHTKDKPPYFMGSQLRGAFGYALKNVSLSLYDRLIEEKNIIHPYRFDIRLGMMVQEFSLYLFADLCSEVHMVIVAIDEMIRKIGLGRDKKTYNNYTLMVNDVLVYANGELHNFDDGAIDFIPPKPKKDIILRLDTPLRIKKDGLFVRNEQIEINDILNSIYQRSRAIKGKKHKALPFVPQYKCKSKNIYFKDLTRKSNAQNTKMQLGGIMGDMWLSDLDKKSYKLLKLGELIGVGKQCVFGLGNISISIV